jgi:predicted ATP-grasp superfamily ATP-dependent carboligase
MKGLKALVTDAHSTAALAVVRSLSRAGMSITVAAEHGSFNLAAHSRFAQRVLRCTSAEKDPIRYAGQISGELRHLRYDLLIPLTDTTITIVRQFRQQLEGLVQVALPPNDILEAARDKRLTIAIAQSHGIAVPVTHCFASFDELAAAAPDLSYPCVAKPRFSGRWDNGAASIRRGRVRFASSPERLRSILREGQDVPSAYLIQSLVSGAGVGIFALVERGEPLAVFAHRRMRETNPTGGRASLARSIPPDERLVGPALRLLKAMRWHGIAMVEFKDPGPPAAPLLMEVNGRFWGSLPLASAAGVDFPVLLAQLLLGRPVAAPKSYRVGVQCRYLKGDLSFLTAVLKGRPPYWNGPFPGRLEALAAIAPWPGRWRPYNFRVDDPLPALWEAGEYMIQTVESAIARFRGSTGRRNWSEV